MIKNLLRRIFALLAICLSSTISARAQSSLSTGDLLFTSFNALPVGGDTFSFVLMMPVSSFTSINFTDKGYIAATNNYYTATQSEGTITWTTTSVLPAGTEIVIAQTGNQSNPYVSYQASNGAVQGYVTRVDGHPSYGISLASTGDQIFAYQGSSLSGNTYMIAGLHYNNCTGGTTSAGWDVGCVSGPAISQLPPNLQAGISAVWVLGNANPLPSGPVVEGVFNCTGVPAYTASIKMAVNNPVNWQWSTNMATSTLPTPYGCTFFYPPVPYISGQPSSDTVCAGSSTILNVSAIGSAISYQWQVSTSGTTGTYVPVSGTNYSGAATGSLTITDIPAAFNTYAYRCVLTNSGGSATSNPAVLTVAAGVPTITQNPADQTICLGSNTTFSASGAGGTVSYQWQVNTGSGYGNIINGGIYSGAGTATLSITGSAGTMNGYLYRAVLTNECGTTVTGSATLRIGNIWTGALSSDWSNTGNWSCGSVPISTTDAFIPAIAQTMPVVNIAAVTRDLNIDLGATVTMGVNQTLQINGNLNNLGTFNAATSGSTVNFSSAAAQSIGEGTYNILSVTNGSTKTLAGNITINGSLTMPSGKIMTGAYLITFGAAATISSGVGSANYIITNGGPGSGVRKLNIGSGGTGSFIFPIGASATSYTPMQVANSGTLDNFTARVINGVYASYTNDVPAGAPIASSVVNKTWFVSEGTAGGSNATLAIQWNQSDELAPFVRTAISLSHYTNGLWSPMPVVSPAGGVGNGPYVVSRTGITSFSPFGIGNVNTPLPVFWNRVTALYKKDQVTVRWDVSDERNLLHYQVQRSADGRSFTNIGSVPANNKVEASGYLLEDQNVESGKQYYYRIVAVDADQTEHYSTVVRVTIPVKNSDVTIIKNPVGASLQLDVNTPKPGKLELSISDVNGRMVLTHSIAVDATRQIVSVPTDKMQMGQIYYVRVQVNKEDWIFKIIK